MANADKWLAKQKEVWGDGNDWARVVDRLREGEAVMLGRVNHLCANGGTADEVVAAILSVLAPPDDASPAVARAMERYRKRESDVLADVANAMERGVVTHWMTWRVADTFLRGWRDIGGPAVEVFPDGYNASTQA